MKGMYPVSSLLNNKPNPTPTAGMRHQEPQQPMISRAIPSNDARQDPGYTADFIRSSVGHDLTPGLYSDMPYDRSAYHRNDRMAVFPAQGASPSFMRLPMVNNVSWVMAKSSHPPSSFMVAESSMAVTQGLIGQDSFVEAGSQSSIPDNNKHSITLPRLPDLDIQFSNPKISSDPDSMPSHSVPGIRQPRCNNDAILTAPMIYAEALSPSTLRASSLSIPPCHQNYLVCHHAEPHLGSPEIQLPSTDPSGSGITPTKDRRPEPSLRYSIRAEHSGDTAQQHLQQTMPRQGYLLQLTPHGDGELVQLNCIERLICCMQCVVQELLCGSLDNAMRYLAGGIRIVNGVGHYELKQTSLNRFEKKIVPIFQCLSIITLGCYDRLVFPSIKLQENITNRHMWSIHLPKRNIDPLILEAMQYIREVNRGSKMDSRFPPGKPVVSEKQEEIAASFDRWYHTLFAFGGVSQYQSPIHAETDMKYLTIKICISVCRFQDESAYDSFSEFFKRIVQAATWILENCSKRTSESTERRFDFETSYLPLLEFVIVKCRWLEIRYQALDIVWKLATGSREPVACGNLYSVGMRMIKEEHNVKNENVASTTADLPSEEIRVREYRTDPRFLELVTVPIVDTERPAEVEVPYTQRLLLWCGSPELAILVRKLERRRCSQQESFISKAVVGSF